MTFDENPALEAAAAPLAGVRVVEAGRFASGPSCATTLADWGAEVIKLEPPTGDPARGPGSLSTADGSSVNPRFDVHNRSRRSVALDVTIAQNRAAADRLIGSADVFVTNMRPSALLRLGLDPQRQRTLHPRLVYAQITGYGHPGAENIRSFDHGAFWSYSGMADLFAGGTGCPPQPAGGLGDRATGTALAGAVCAALLSRTRTGRGAHVTTSLVRTAMWLMASDVADALRVDGHVRGNDRTSAPLPTLNCYRCADGRWIWLQSMRPHTEWTALLTALDAAWLDDDPRFHGGKIGSVSAQHALIETLDEVFRQRQLDEWSERLSAAGIASSPVRTLSEAVRDVDVAASGAFLEVNHDGGTYTTVASPCTFADGVPVTATPPPRLGADTEQVLRELGVADPERTAVESSV